MTQLRHLLAGEAKVETVERDMILSADPMSLNRTQFERYLRAKGEALGAELAAAGLDQDGILEGIRIAFYRLDAGWREEARRRAIAKRREGTQ